MNKKIIEKAIFLVLFLFLFFSCKSIPSMDNVVNYYSYDYELLFNFSEYNLMFQENSDYNISQNFTKKATGMVVLMNNNSFIEPDFGYRLVISPTGAITSPDNPTVQGKYKDNGDIYWRAVDEVSGFFRNILVTGKLQLSTENERASSKYNGSFELTDPRTGRKQQVLIHNGMYFWKYAQKEMDDFEPWPIIVFADGSFATSLKMITRSCLTFSEMDVPIKQKSIYSTEQYTQGQIQVGSIEVRTVTKTLGSGMGTNPTQDFSYSGTVASVEQQEKLKTQMNQVLTTGYKKIEAKPKSIPPKWFVADMNLSENKLFGRGSKNHSDKAEALRLAEIAAVGDLISAISLEVKSQSLATETDEEKKLYQIVETVSSQHIEYKVVNSFFDEEFLIAYVMVEAL